MDKASGGKKMTKKTSASKKTARATAASKAPAPAAEEVAASEEPKAAPKRRRRSVAPPSEPAVQPGSSWQQPKSAFRSFDEDDEFSSKLDMIKVVSGLKRHVLLVLLIGAIFAGGGWALSRYMQAVFIAESFVVYQEERPTQLGGSFTISQYSLPTMVEMMKLPVHFRAVKSLLGLNYSVEDIMEMTAITAPRGQSNLVRITCKADNPNLAVDVSNALSKVVVKHSEELSRKQLQNAYEYFKGQRSEAQASLEKHDAGLANFKQSNPHFELDSGHSTLIDSAAKAQSEYHNAALQYNSLLVEYENLKRESSKVPDHTVKYAFHENPLKDRIAQTEMALLEARTRYATDNPKIKILETSLKELRKMLAESSMDEESGGGKVYEKNPLKESLNIELMRFQGKLRSSQKLKEDLRRSLERAEKELEGLPEDQMQYARLIQKKRSTEEELHSLDDAVRSTELFMNLGKGDIDVYQGAEEAKPIASKWKDLLPFFPLIGLMLGCFFGLGIAFVVEAADRRLWTATQVEMTYSIPCLQVIPDIRSLARKDSEQELLFTIRNLTERLEGLNDGMPPPVICLTSSFAGEGKSALASNLARYYQNRLDCKVLYAEFDPRPNPFIDRKKGGKEETFATIEEHLRGDASFKDIVQEDGQVDRIKAGWDSGMKELIKSGAMADLWKKLQSQYDIIIIEAPSVIEDDYATNLARLAGCCLFVVNSQDTKQAHVDESLRELESKGIVPVGLILNRVWNIYVRDVRIRNARRRANRARWRKRLGKDSSKARA